MIAPASTQKTWHNRKGEPAHGQYFTPEWCAEFLVQRYFGDLGPQDVVVEPSCGPGAFLKAIPDNIRAYGVEIDPGLAEMAARDSGRRVICGDFRTVPLEPGTTALIGNPPFRLDLLDGFLNRAGQILPTGGRCGFILSAGLTQTGRNVARWNRDWSIEGITIPRNIFHNLMYPLMFCLFRKDQAKTLVGFALFHELEAIRALEKDARTLLTNGRPRERVWHSLVTDSLRHLGGVATLPDLYRLIGPKAPEGNSYPREKIRQTLLLGEDRNFRRRRRGLWELIPTPPPAQAFLSS